MIKGDAMTLGPWHRGVFYNLPPEEVPADGLSDMENVRVGQAGQCEKRPGCASYQSAAVLSGTPAPTLTLSCQLDLSTGTSHVVIAAGTALYKYSSGWSAITGSTTITAGDDNVFDWANANDTLVICNGVDTAAIKWTGTGDAAALDVDARFTNAARVAWWDNRLWLGRVSGALDRVYYSATGDIETWAAADFKAAGMPITGLAPLDDLLAVHTEKGIWAITATGNSSIPYEIHQVTQRGSLSGRGIVTLPGLRQLMVLRDGIYRWDKEDGTVTKISYALDDAYWPTLNKARLKMVFGVYCPDTNEVWYMLPYGTSQTNLNQLMIYGEYEHEDEEKYRWYGPWKGGTAYERNCGGLIADKPHLGSYAGFLYDMDTGTNDVSTAVAAHFTTGWVQPDPESPELQNRWLFCRTYYDGTGYYPVVAGQRNEDGTGTTKSFTVQGSGFVLGTSRLGDAMQGRQMAFADTPLLGYGSHMGMLYSNGAADQTFSVRRALVHYRGLGRKHKRGASTAA